ncbi:MAG: hypothetical protein UT66_C0046G0006 [candidate division CPR2 bacterium GW2011_GWC1_39_9]|nr:MAG: hypothetical protein UT66_C0046G0006 [candidate division CPR2 bacterium GW2011_GWC1_39_9]
MTPRRIQLFQAVREVDTVVVVAMVTVVVVFLVWVVLHLISTFQISDLVAAEQMRVVLIMVYLVVTAAAYYR